MSSYTVIRGWLCVPYSGPNMATVHVALGAERTPPEPDSDAWQPAYLDAPNGQVKVRCSGLPKRTRVWLRTNGTVERVT